MHRRKNEERESPSEVDLAGLRPGESGTVVRIAGGHGVVKRLEVLGVKPGVTVTKVSSQMLRGPVTFRVGSSQYAIGFGMARRVIVRR
ncbi:MAG: ferrous iron transport protein A [Calditrichaeota bacterium]|nr:ferrous iron transport protein A [Calditrichota bacterium]